MGALFAKNNLQDVVESWKHIAPLVHEPQTSHDYAKLTALLDIFGKV